MCPNNFFLHSPDFLFLSLHITSFFSIPTHLFGAYCILFNTPRRMKSVKMSLLWLHFCTCFVDFALSILTTPFVLMPILAGYPLGVLSLIGVSAADQSYFMVVTFGVMGVSIVGIFENRYLVLSPNHYTWKRIRNIWFILNYLIAFIFFLPTYVEIPKDQESGKQYVLQELPCLSADIKNLPIVLITRYPVFSELITAITTAFFVLQAIFFFHKTAQTLDSYNEKLSKSTINLHKILNPKWEEMEFIFVATAWILITCVCKPVFTKLKQNKLINVIPESALQIFLGLGLAALFNGIGLDKKFYIFDAHVFFAFLLPPIIFDAGFFMPNREFFGNFDSIMTFAVVGTVFNTFAIGICLSYFNGFGRFSMEMKTSEVLLFASLISAVDPVAVIAVFEEMHVNKPLFVNVFGEALFNDAISVVLFGIFKSFVTSGASESSSESLGPLDYFLGFLAFFIVSFGGVLIGILSAFSCAIATKFSSIMAPLLVFVLAYLGYVVSEIFSFSSIIAAAVCGMVVKQYLERNLTGKSLETVAQMTRNFAISSESLTFIFLGLATISVDHHWDTLFISSTIILCLIFRFIAIFGLAFILRVTRNKKISLNELLIISFGGLRGAIAFGVVLSMPDGIPAKPMFITATLSVIYFSVIIQGVLIRPLIRMLKIEKLEAEDSSEGYSSGIQEMQVEDQPDAGPQKFKKMFDDLNNKYLLPVLTRTSGRH